MYLEYVEAEEERERCQARQAHMDKYVQPRTETYEHLTCKKQRESFTKKMPHRIVDCNQLSRRYSDYQEAKAYHEQG